MKLRTHLAIMLMLIMFAACQSQTAEKLIYPEEGAADEQLFQSRCGVCHGAPLPGSRKRQLWANIVYRMQTNITVNGYVPLTQSETKRVLDYLERNAPL